MLKNIDEYWLSVRCQAKRVYPKKKLILHIHVDLRLEYIFGHIGLRLE
jgi:hypothetical protein